MILFVSPATVFGDPFGIMVYLLAGAIGFWLVAFAVNFIARRVLLNGGLISAVTIAALFLAALLHHLVDPAPWLGENGMKEEPTAHFLARYLKAVGVPFLLSLVVSSWFQKRGTRLFLRKQSRERHQRAARFENGAT